MTQSAATHPQEPVRAVVADAANLPVPDAAADCAVAFMSLHDIDDVVPAIAEIGRILAVGGKLVMAIVHPLNSAGYFERDAADPKPPYIIRDAYTEARHYTTTRTRDDLLTRATGVRH